MDSSWWEDCAGDMEINKIKVCARGMEGRTLLRENISLNKELGILMGPTYLLGNQEIFASQGAPSNEELKKILKDK
jgi:protein-disulfide isomerase